MKSVTPSNIIIRNTYIRTEYINEGLILTSDCTILTNNQIWGDVIFENFTITGDRYLNT